jgi:hypothetical protein
MTNIVSPQSAYANDEATSKTCPLSFSAGRTSSCVGSACMAWRWVNAKAGHDVRYHLSGQHRNNTELAMEKWKEFHREERLVGRCGMAT